MRRTQNNSLISGLIAVTACLPFSGCFEQAGIETATSASGSSSTSNANSFGFNGASAATNLDGTRIKVSWVPASSSIVTGYTVYTVGASNTLTPVGAVPKTATSFTHTGLTACNTYVYIVRAFDARGNNDGNLNGVTGLTYAGITSTTPVSSTSSTVTFPSCSSASTLAIYCATDGSSYTLMTTAANTSTSATITGLTASTLYTCKVNAISPNGKTDGNTATASAGMGQVCITRPSGLVSWWDGDSGTSGVYATDTISTYNMNLSNVTMTSGKVGNALSLSGTNSATSSFGSTPSTTNLNFTTAMTALAWVKPTTSYASAIPSSILSKGDFQTTMVAGSFAAYDISANVYSTLKGFNGATFDGRYVYFVPYNNGAAFGTVARYDTTKTFASPGSWSYFDMTTLAALAKGYSSAVFDGRYIYFVPLHNGAAYHANFVRYDTTANFTSSSSWKVIDLTTFGGTFVTAFGGYTGGVFDGRYIYFTPWTNGTIYSSYVIRYDTTASQFDSNSNNQWVVYNNPVAAACWGGVFDGRYFYCVPYNSGAAYGIVGRYDTTQTFDSNTSTQWVSMNLPVSVNATAKGFWGGTFDGRYVYLTPYNNGANDGVVTRHDTTKTFTAATSWEVYDVTAVNASSKGFLGSIFDGRYVYLVPSNSGASGLVTRFDTTGQFSGTTASWSTFDMTTVNAGAKGFSGAVFDGRYIYFVPQNNGAADGVVVQYDTLGSTGTTFNLKAGHVTSSLGHGVVGPTFQVTTANGTYSVSAGTSLSTGTWHLIAGTYDGSNVTIYVDGVAQASVLASGTMVSNTSPVKLGAFGTTNTGFNGLVDEAQVYNTALTETQIQNIYLTSSLGICK